MASSNFVRSNSEKNLTNSSKTGAIKKHSLSNYQYPSSLNLAQEVNSSIQPYITADELISTIRNYSTDIKSKILLQSLNDDE